MVTATANDIIVFYLEDDYVITLGKYNSSWGWFLVLLVSTPTSLHSSLLSDDLLDRPFTQRRHRHHEY